MIKSKKETRIIPAEDFAFLEVEPDEDKSFTFIVLTRNHGDSIERNIDSILSQKYSQYRVVYIDQGSTDGTVEKIRQRKTDKISLVECQEDHEVYKRYYDLVSHLKNDEIIVHLYGNDWLAHEEVLRRLNVNYMNPDVWLTYGQYIDSANYERGILDPQPKKTLYKKRVQRAPWVVAPFKTYYAGLFKKLHVEAGYFISIKDESAMLTPMVEMAKAHVRFIPHVLYIHSDLQSRKGKKGRVAMMADRVKGAMEKSYADTRVDLVILSEDSPEDLRACLTSCAYHLQGLSKTHVIYQCTPKNYATYEEVKQEFPEVWFTRPLNYGEANLKKELLASLWRNAESAPYVLLSSDQVKVTSSVTLPICVAAMQKTRAYGFYFHLGKEEGDGGIYSWNIHRSEGDFQRPDSLQMGLYRRLELEQELKKLSFVSVPELIRVWGEEKEGYRVGLSFEESKVSTFSRMLTQS